MSNILTKKFILLILASTFTFANSLSDAFIKVSKSSNPAVVSIVGKQEANNSFQDDPFFRYFPEFSDFHEVF